MTKKTGAENPSKPSSVASSGEVAESPLPNHVDKTRPEAIVGIGASAGGLTALRNFFECVPKDSGLAFVVVVHLSPEHESHLAELLQPHCAIPVIQVRETMGLESNHVYVIPPNANLNTIDTHLRLTELEKNRRERAPIDHFFRTLARTHDGESIGIILTGTGSDGTLGIREIKGKGGLVIVQDPIEAEFDGMPQSAIATGLPDFILPIKEMAATLIRYSATRPRVAHLNESEPDADDAQLLQDIFSQLLTTTGRNFSSYKRPTILRRIQRRMQIHQLLDLSRYLEMLNTKPDEVKALADDLLITVTSFFRDPEVFEMLATEVFPSLFNGKSPEDQIRIWSVGCSTGEEAYSLAMLLMDEASKQNPHIRLQIFASDLHEKSLAKAREGFYPGDIETDVPPEKLARYFIKDNGGYRIRKEVRELVTFAPHNLLSDPPFSKIDLISCRNLLIYVGRQTQRDIMRLFHYSLKTEGYLALGSSETVEEGELYTLLNKKCCVYKKRNVLAPDQRPPVFPAFNKVFPPAFNLQSVQDRSLQHSHLHLQALEFFSAPSVLIGTDDQLLHLSKNAGKYLMQPGGEYSANILKIVSPELRTDLRRALQVVREQNAVVRTDPVYLNIESMKVQVALDVRPVPGIEYSGFVLVIFEEGDQIERQQVDLKSTRSAVGNIGDAEDPEGRYAQEINLLRRQLQNTVHEYELGQEAMRATYEEMQSTNEELRSTMEELETSKEELQSMNEELQTVNQENRHKVEEYAQLSGDLQNLLFATDIATLFLDREFRIMRFTPRTSDIFNLRLTDRGRPLTDITHCLLDIDMKDDAAQVLKTLVPAEREICDENGRWYLTRMLPYRSSDDRIEGIVITFVDITRRKNSEDALRLSDQRKTEFLATLAHELRNPLSAISSGIEVLKLAGKELIPYQDLTSMMHRQMNQLVELVNDLLDISRISSGKFELKKQRVELQDLIHNALEASLPALQERGHRLSLDVPDGAITLHADPNRLMQVLMNLLSNSTKFTPEGGHIKLHAYRAANTAFVSIKDNGKGIAGENLERVFEMFEQVGEFKGKENSGLGIGLSLTRTLVEMHGGNISIHSDGLDKGCEVIFQLPVMSVAEAGASGVDVFPRNGANKEKFKVLIVDDNAAALQSLEMLLKVLGHSVQTAGDGEAALAIAGQGAPDVIFLDLGMPKMDGYEVARRIRGSAWGRKIPLVALSGWGAEEDVSKSRVAGFNHHLIKPLRIDEMNRILSQLTGAALISNE